MALDDGRVWVLAYPRSSSPTLFDPIKRTAALWEVDPGDHGVTHRPIRLSATQPVAIASARHGLWIADYHSSSVTRIDTIGSISAGAIPNTPCRYSASEAGSLIGRRQLATVALPLGCSTRAFTVHAVASHPYDLNVEAPRSAGLGIQTNTPGRTLAVLYTVHSQSCNVRSGHVSCLLHFAAGRNPGGQWTVVITKRSAPPAAVAVSVPRRARA
ncbi:MAG: hypothetical protein ACR2NR_10865 [Solirubrobacteraceae bacterium]